MLLNNFKIILYILIGFIVFIPPGTVLTQNIDGVNKNAKPLTRHLVKLPNADAKNAIEIQDSIAGPFNVSLGYGLKKEIPHRSNITQCYEENSAWFKFTVDYDTVLTLDIVPFDSLNNYDFILFKCPGADCIDAQGKGRFKIVRECWSQCSSQSGMTGLSNYAAGAETGSGIGPGYLSSIRVKAGEVYYLMINYCHIYLDENNSPAGFMIYFYNYCPKIKPIVLNNLFFETGNAVLQKESFPELDKLVSQLSKSRMVIEVRGHTDNTGDEEKNKQLSEERAKAVADYLVSKKINKNRLFYKGFGSAKPIASNNTKEGRQKNRRVEFIKVMY